MWPISLRATILKHLTVPKVYQPHNQQKWSESKVDINLLDQNFSNRKDFRLKHNLAMSEVDKQKRERVSQRVKELRQKASTNEKTISRRTSSVSDFSPISSAPQSGTATPTTTTSTIDSGSWFDFYCKAIHPSISTETILTHLLLSPDSH